MPLFQKSVENKYLSDLDPVLIDTKYKAFQEYFGNHEIQENIRNSKEEQFQEGFLRELFVEILGYTLNPNPDFNLTTELKNTKDAKKTDGAIIKDGNAIAVIELKSTSTSDLDSVENQAFGYKNNHPKCVYIITSNFEKLRFYIQDAVEYIEFDLFRLSKESFSLLWLCLSKDNALRDVPLRIKELSLVQEENITKRLYADYTKFRELIYESIVKNNVGKDKHLLFKKTQKLLDRFLFVFFAEDRLLLPPNSISEIVQQWMELKYEYDEYFPLYDRFKKYFGYLNTGHKGKNFDIYPYNGGLFETDDILDNLILDDDILHEHALRLSAYDYQSEVDVNVLGHIFENSLSDIEAIKAEIDGKSVDRQQNKRKRDGVFYTPKYITKYMVENTVGKLCYDKRMELGVVDEEYSPNQKKATKAILLKKLDAYREWLFEFTILDPACGSGAFLNQTLDFLINEHHKIDTLKSKLLGESLVFSDIEKEILEKNIFGVDINEESVEIAKLSLWLRTASKGRKLNTLSSAIKCGNSLIDDPEIAGSKAFNWEKEFPEVFAKGGFDVVIGNPPYVNVELMSKEEKEYYSAHYTTFYKRSDMFSLFIDISLSRLTLAGKVSFIVPSQIFNNLSYKKIREVILSNKWLKEICYVGSNVFADAVNDVAIIVLDKSKSQTIRLIDALNFFNPTASEVHSDYFAKYDNVISISDDTDSGSIYEKMFSSENKKLSDYCEIFQGIVTGNNAAYIFDSKSEYSELNIEKELLNPLLHGRDIGKWLIKSTERRILYVTSDTVIDKYPNAKIWLCKYKSDLLKRRECRNGVIPWFSLQWPRDKEQLDVTPKIIVQNTRNERLKTRIVATVAESNVYGSQGLNFIVPFDKTCSVYFIISILNSSLMNYLFRTKYLNLAIKADYLKSIPLPSVSASEQQMYIDKSKLLLKSYELQYKQVDKFNSRLLSNYHLSKVSNMMLLFYRYEYAELLVELKKHKARISLKEQDELEEYFSSNKSELLEREELIDNTVKELDVMVYNLYGLSVDEIKIVDKS
jgi:type I restriction-modification system DNA methylase subunit